MRKAENGPINVVFGFQISIVHVISYNVALLAFFEVLIAFWADRNSWFNSTAALFPLKVYVGTAIPGFLLVGSFLKFYKKLRFGTSKLLWFLFLGISVPMAGLCGVGSIFAVPGIFSDGSEGWSIIISSFVFPPFIVFSSLCLLLLEKKKIDLFKKTFYFDDEGKRIDPKYD